MAEYDNENVFAKILRGDMPSFKVYEDENTYAFMDIMPRGDGHCLVIPKKACRNLLDAEPETLGPFIGKDYGAGVHALSHALVAV